jgi:hypothetical protein
LIFLTFSFLPFFLSRYTAYPIVICYRCFLYNNKRFTKQQTNLLFTVCGIVICIFNYGFEVYHSLIAVTFTYVTINLLYKTRYLVPVSFTFHMSYLLIGNYPISSLEAGFSRKKLQDITRHRRRTTTSSGPWHIV